MEQELERLYNPSNWSKRYRDPQLILQNFYHLITSKSKELEEAGGIVIEKNVRYGQGEATLLDVYKRQEPVPDGKLFVFIHGGYWQEGCKDSYGFFKPLVESGFTVLVPGYDLAPQVSVKEIMKEIKQFYEFLNAYASNLNIEEVWVCGHSAGAQLALSLLLEVSKHANPDLITGFLLISGVYNLQPIVSTSNNAHLRLTHNEANEVSPLNWDKEDFLQRIRNKSFLLVVGQEESPAFIKQTTDMKKWLERNGVQSINYQCLPEYDHFNIITDLFEKNSAISKCIQSSLACSQNSNS